MGVIWDFIKSLAIESFPPKSKFTIEDVSDATRNEIKGKEAVEKITKETGKSPVFLKLDLADLDSIQAAASEFLSKEIRLDVLYNSACYFYLIKLFLPLLTSTAKTSPQDKVRIIFVSLGAHHISNLSFSTSKTGPRVLYRQCKFGEVALAKEVARRYGEEGIVSLAMNPGDVNTNLQKESPGWQARLILHYFSRPDAKVGEELWTWLEEQTAGQ
ncbi:NAD-P-binding protein [Mycena olivaceomarginata]|nr:NAD-P-binding protein [Mycena olivaceomarginata]